MSKSKILLGSFNLPPKYHGWVGCIADDMQNPPDIPQIFPRHPPDIPNMDIPQISSRYIPAISQISLRISPKICQKYHPEIKIFPRRHKDIPNILPTPYISPRYPQDVPIYPEDMSNISAKISLSPRYPLGISQISGLVWSALKGFEQCGTLKPKCRELTGLVHL